MTLKPLGAPGPEPEHPFTDREPAIQAFARALDELPTLGDGHRVLDFHGVAGAGKSDLLLRRLLPMARDRKDRVCWLKLDFENREHRQRPQALFELRKQAFARFKADCPRFDLAYLIWFGKSNPQLLLNEKQFSLGAEGGLAAGILSQAGELAWTGLLPNIGTCVRRLGGSLKQWWTQRGESMLRKLADMEAHAIESELHRYLAAELSQALKVCPNDAVRARVEGRQTSERFLVVFLDTFEAFGRDAGPRTDGRTRESWVRELVQELPGALWVLLGRDRLTWQDDDDDWKDVVEARDLEEFLPADAESFLRGCGIADPALIQAITKLSALPFYLDISVKTWERLRAGVAEGGREPAPEDFAGAPDEVLDRFVRNYLDQNEKPLLCRLALARFWDRDLGLALIEHFHFGPLRDALDELKRYSFVKRPAPGRFALHELMAQALERELSPEAHRETHEFLFEYYESQLKDMTPETVDAAKQQALGEAFFHKAKIAEARECLRWLDKRSKVFIDAWAYEGILPILSEALRLARHVAEDLNTLASYKDLAITLERYGEALSTIGTTTFREEAIIVYNESVYIKLMLCENGWSECQIDLAIGFEKLGDLYFQIGEKEDIDCARRYYKESMDILINIPKIFQDYVRIDIARCMLKCADMLVLYNKDKNMEIALKLYLKSLKIFRTMTNISFEEKQRNISVVLNKCGDYYMFLESKNCMKALAYYNKCLSIRESLLSVCSMESYRDYAVILERCGTVYVELGGEANIITAVKLYIQSMGIRCRLAGSKLAQSLYDVSYLLELLESLLKILDTSPTQVDPALLEEAKRQVEAARELLDSLPASQ